MKRRASREYTMKILYQLHIHKDDFDKIIATSLEKAKNVFDINYVDNVINGIQNNKNDVTELIIKNLKGWKISRISKVDLAILELAVYEIKFMKDIPINVSINEAIEITKKFSSKKSASFINGVLSSIARNAVEK